MPFLVIGTVLMLVVGVVAFATNPLGVIAALARLIAFLIAAGFWILYAVMTAREEPGAWGYLAFAIPATIVWLALVRRRSR